MAVTTEGADLLARQIDENPPLFREISWAMQVSDQTIWTWRTRRWLTACGWASLVLVATLSWTLPWYIIWLLPFAALSRSRGLRIAAAVLGVYIYLAWMPYSSEILGFLHVNPANTTLGQQEQNFMRTLLF